MPRMQSLNIQNPNLANVLSRSETIKGQRMQNALAERAMKREPERYELEKSLQKQKLQSGKQRLRAGDVAYKLEKLKTMSSLFRNVKDQAGYDRAVESYIRIFPDEIGELKQVPREYNPEFVNQMVLVSETAAERVAKMNLAGKAISAANKPFTLGEGQTRFDAQGKPIARGPEKQESTPKTAMAKYLRDNPNATSEEIAAYANTLKGKGVRMSLPDGTIVEVGGAAGEMTKKTQGTLEGGIIDVQDSISRLNTIKESFDRNYLNVGKRFDFLVTGWKQKWEGTPVGKILGSTKPEEVEKARKYWKFRQDAVANLNKEIKWLTGAAMNKEEVPRLQQEVPNAGLGLFDGDAPDEFESKLYNKISQANLYLARYVMMLRQDITPSKIKGMGKKNMLPGESQVRKAINDYATSLEQQGFDTDEIRSKVRRYFYTMEEE